MTPPSEAPVPHPTLPIDHSIPFPVMGVADTRGIDFCVGSFVSCWLIAIPQMQKVFYSGPVFVILGVTIVLTAQFGRWLNIFIVMGVLDEQKPVTLFGRDLADIPCFRSSWLYGISGGIGAGLLYFLFTSKTRMASHVAMGSMCTITLSYWSICRYDLHRQATELQRLKDYVDKKALIEGTEMEKVVEVEVAKV